MSGRLPFDIRLLNCRWYEAKQVQPRFAFGHGLSYTTFQYPNMFSAVSINSDEVIKSRGMRPHEIMEASTGSKYLFVYF
jgi:hypothetical protein